MAAALGVRFYGVVSDQLAEALEIFSTRAEAQSVVHAWDQDEPDQVGALRVEPIELMTGSQ
jgi:hypothetical protein